MGARLKARATTHPSKKGSEKVCGRVLGKRSQKGCENGLGFTVQESPRQTKPKKGPKRKAHELHPFV